MEKITLWNCFLSFPWVPGVKLRSSHFCSKPFTWGATSWAPIVPYMYVVGASFEIYAYCFNSRIVASPHLLPII